MKSLKNDSIFLDKKLTKVILSSDLMELFSPYRKRGYFRKRAAGPPPGHSYLPTLLYNRRAS
jgi:hypothetical protein